MEQTQANGHLGRAGIPSHVAQTDWLLSGATEDDRDCDLSVHAPVQIGAM